VNQFVADCQTQQVKTEPTFVSGYAHRVVVERFGFIPSLHSGKRIPAKKRDRAADATPIKRASAFGNAEGQLTRDSISLSYNDCGPKEGESWNPSQARSRSS
jgi:hypothetical protein